MHLNIHYVLHNYGYWGVLFILLVEMVGIPFPAETTLTISGLELSKGEFKLLPLLLAAVIGNIIGSTIAYWIGRLLGRPVIERFGKYVGLTGERLNKAEHSFSKHQSGIVIACKFIAGIRVSIPYLAGINKMNFAVFSILNSISAFLWVLLFTLFGRYIGIEWIKYHKTLHQYIVPIIILITIIVGGIITLKLRNPRKKSGEE